MTTTEPTAAAGTARPTTTATGPATAGPTSIVTTRKARMSVPTRRSSPLLRRSTTQRPMTARRTALVAFVSALALIPAACVPPPPAPTPAPSARPGVTPIMGTAKVSAAQLSAWYRSKNITDARPAVSVDTLASLFISEGRAEGVAGDLAFVQSMVETGWLRHSARVPPTYFNYAGIGAVDNGTGAAKFPDARTGVRAQIQHLRAYADPTTTCSNFAHPRVTPRCHLVSPKGKARTWEQMGKGNWATDPDYSQKVLRLYEELRAHAGR